MSLISLREHRYYPGKIMTIVPQYIKFLESRGEVSPPSLDAAEE